MSCVAKSSVPSFTYRENCVPDRPYFGYYRFNEDQYYDGEFFRDGFHGQGSYQWGDVAVYEGGFYSNSKEGYAVVSFPDNSNFEGLFIMNKPFGPGILTYANGRQDVGFWVGRKLVRLSRAVDFIIPRLAPSSAAKIKLLQFKRLIPLDENTWDLNSGTDILKKCGYPFEHFYSPYSSLIYDPRSIFFDTLAFEKIYFKKFTNLTVEFGRSSKEWENSLIQSEEAKQDDAFKESPVPGPCLSLDDFDEVESDICDFTSSEGEKELGILGFFTKFGIDQEENKDEVPGESFQGEVEATEDKSGPTKIVPWNRTELCVEMLKQIFRHRAFEEKLNFNLTQLMVGARTEFRKTGLKEKECLEFLKLCSIGPPQAVKNFLCNFEISQELMDSRGNNSLMFAAATDQHEIIDILLGYGVDVNTFNDENLTPLNLCLLRRLANTHGIFSWETAFLPKEIEGVEDYTETQPWQFQESISSLDRIFGDGKSINNSRTFVLRSPSSPSHLNKESSNDSGSLFSFRSKEFSNFSQTTVQNITKSPGGRSLTQSNHKIEIQSSLRISFSASEVRVNSGTSESKKVAGRCVKTEPKFIKGKEFLRSIKMTSKDKYLFEFTFGRNPNARLSKLLESSENLSTLEKESKHGEVEEKEDEMGESWAMGEYFDFRLGNKLKEIDKTIEQLLERGANPNISEVPKPSIHLGVYTKDLNVVRTLLFYGANPNSQLYPNEGLLTPLHEIVLQNAAPEYVDICRLLLNFDADPNKNTSPEFIITEEEVGLLDSVRGRNPLQLLCMRPDLEVADPDGYLIKIGLMLAEKTNRKSMFNGHSYLSLAMLNGNVKLLRALMETNLFDVNEILGNDRGTALHVLVSRELQKKNNYQGSIEMCDLLLEQKANPLITFKEPKNLVGNCVDYGYREIEAEKEARKASSSNSFKKAEKKSKTGKDKSEDYLGDHIKVVEYLEKKVSEMSTKEKDKKPPDSSIKRKGQKETPRKEAKDKKGKEDKEEDKEKDEKGEEKEKYTNKKKSKKEGDVGKGDKISKETTKKGADEGKGKDKKRGGDQEKKKLDEKNKKKQNKEETKSGKGDENQNQKQNNKGQLGKELKPKTFQKPSQKSLAACSETFPEKIRQSLLRVYGHCITFDINELLVPYVVLRDGDLYYKFKGNTKSQEQYSLI